MLKTKTIQDLMWIANHLDTKPDDSHDMRRYRRDKHLYQDAYSLEMEDISTRQEELECI